MNVQTNYGNNNLLIADVRQLNKIITLKTLWDGQGKIKMHYWMSKVKKQLSGKKSISRLNISYVCRRQQIYVF